jgi:hypothetical protein
LVLLFVNAPYLRPIFDFPHAGKKDKGAGVPEVKTFTSCPPPSRADVE